MSERWQHLTEFAVLRRLRQAQRDPCDDFSVSSWVQIVAAAVLFFAAGYLAFQLYLIYGAHKLLKGKMSEGALRQLLGKIKYPLIQYSLLFMSLLLRVVLALLYYTDSTENLLLLAMLTAVPTACMALVFSTVCRCGKTQRR